MPIKDQNYKVLNLTPEYLTSKKITKLLLLFYEKELVSILIQFLDYCKLIFIFLPKKGSYKVKFLSKIINN